MYTRILLKIKPKIWNELLETFKYDMPDGFFYRIKRSIFGTRNDSICMPLNDIHTYVRIYTCYTSRKFLILKFVPYSYLLISLKR